MARLHELAERYARLPEDLLLVGPTGVGKGYLAEALHAASGRTGRCVTVTGGQLSTSLWADQIHGHERGGFTGAVTSVPGALAQARGGTLFLDELQHWPPEVQAGLLRPLEARRFTPLGAARELPADCRILYATTADPDGLMQSGALLPDLRYRLPALVLRIPSLAERQGEILPLVSATTARLLVEWQWEAMPIRWAPSALRALLLHTWPGNLRELLHTVKRALAEAGPAPGHALEAADLHLAEGPAGDLTTRLAPEAVPAVLAWALGESGGSSSRAAALLGVHRNTIRNCHVRASGSGLRGPAGAQRGGALGASEAAFPAAREA